MAFKEVELTEEERAAMGATFFKFNAIGDRLAGVFVRLQPQTGQFAKQGAQDYVFKTKSPEGVVVEVVLSPPADAAMKLKKADLKPGHKVIVTYAADKDVGRESPMKVFKVLVDSEVTAKTAAPPKPPPPPAPDLDDIPF